MNDADVTRAEQREISKRNEFEFRKKILEANLAQAQSMLRAAIWEPADVRAKATELREAAVQEARRALDSHLGSVANNDDFDWLFESK